MRPLTGLKPLSYIQVPRARIHPESVPPSIANWRLCLLTRRDHRAGGTRTSVAKVWAGAWRTAALPILITLVACSKSPSEVPEQRLSLSLYGGDVVYVGAGASPVEPFRVIAVDASSGIPVQGAQIQWQVIQGTASLTQPVSTTDFYGVASTSMSPTQAGVYRIRASTQRLEGAAPVLEVRVVPPPVITAVAPSVIAPGGEVTITGSNFSPTAGHNVAFFDGVRGTIVSATSTELRVTVPTCMPARNVAVIAGVGTVLSAPAQVTTTASTGTVLSLQPGQVSTIDAPAFGCLRLQGGQNNTLYMFIAHNAAATMSPPRPFELRALTPTAPAVTVLPGAEAPRVPFAEQWEAGLRARERSLGRPEARAPGEPLFQAAADAAPAVGDQRDFYVLNTSNGFDRITATARRVSERAVLFVDVEAQNAITAADLDYYGGLFDDPIYSTTVGVFGQPSDIDGNDRIFILFTPKVNALTPRGESSFITGFFYGCDLVGRTRCSGSNEAEVFYSLVPDPDGRWSSPRTQATVRAAVPPVLAHEFQHMINFAQRNNSADVLWLSEALAHTAEELVAAVLQATDPVLAASFGQGNLVRAQRYLAAPAAYSPIEMTGNGSLEMRGAAWLFLKHLRSQHGGNDLLRRLTATTRSGVQNVTHETARPWPALVADFGVAVWADGAPALQGQLDPRYQFTGFDLRTALSGVPGGYSLQPTSLSWASFAVAGSIAPGGHAYFLMGAPAGGTVPAINFVLSGAHGAPLAEEAGVRFSVLRVR
jgi:hypothetical protein